MGTSLSTSKPLLTNLHEAAFTYPAIDNHAHPLLRAKHRSDLPFEGLISEAEGSALTVDAPHTLACHRATRQLTDLFGLPEGSTWENIKAKRFEFEYADLCRLSFGPTGIQCILIDDGLGIRDIMHDVSWHDQFTHSPSKRVVRIEVVAEEILVELFALLGNSPSTEELAATMALFMVKLENSLKASAKDTIVVAFKSVVCYRSGLAVSPPAVGQEAKSQEDAELLAAFERVYKAHLGSSKIRLQDKALNDSVVRLALEVSAESGKPSEPKPNLIALLCYWYRDTNQFNFTLVSVIIVSRSRYPRPRIYSP
ncbi:hypothetical protein D9615_008018 [Tricholomella constricta]|uniref:Uncharacterized protein n=1 Tax=Tricholomella constricta TaxID=117010 RepID=A0A8H5H2A2_9AGAR|nr:hypothetical protein D9615_008018 [Tricholomella constricta]